MKVEPADLVVLLEMLGDGRALGDVVLPDWAANAVVGILMTLPGPPGRRSLWPPEIDERARSGLRDGTPIRTLAREIAAATGQSAPAVRRRLQDLNKRRRPARAQAH